MGLSFFIEFILHFDKYLSEIITNFGSLTYLILFVIIFLETGFVFTPFLPGDSLLFVAGAFAAQGLLDVFFIFLILSLAAILGDTLNYWFGSFFGERVFSKSRFFKQEYLEKTKQFYKTHGGKTIIFARFIPIIRTFAPFVAGVGKMNYTRFLGFNIISGFAWVALFVFSGFFFGGFAFVEERLTLFIFLIIIASFIPPLVEYLRHKRKK
ncbi:MAG: DedA family protein [Nanoarchaeota archaeon]